MSTAYCAFIYYLSGKLILILKLKGEVVVVLSYNFDLSLRFCFSKKIKYGEFFVKFTSSPCSKHKILETNQVLVDENTLMSL